jgi:16S rRNA (adenine1518-N6/adenine1519-N6)-dimethyltransferase
MITPKKRLGQNFLSDPNTARKIVAALRVPEGAAVVEIGPGTGALTGALLARYPDLVAVEVDELAVAYLRQKHPALDVRHADVLDVDWGVLAVEKGGPLYVVGNLPYYITSQILFALLDARAAVREAVVMMQLEVAERLVALPRTKAYGILSVQVQLFTRPELLFRVSPNVFFPKPDVTSAVVRLVFREGDEITAGVDPSLLREVVRTAFNQRRKTLRNSLGALTRDRGVALPEAWASRRAEELEPAAFVALTRYLAAHPGA